MKGQSWFALVLLLMSTACQVRRIDNKDYADMNQIPLTPICIGRLIAEVPQRGIRDWEANFDNAKVTRLKEASAEEFWRRVNGRKQELQSQKHDIEPNRLNDFRRIGDNAAIILFRDDQFQTEIMEMERYLWSGDRGYFFDTASQRDSVKNELDRFTTVFSKLKPVARQDKPVDSGFCIDGAAVSSDVGEIGTDFGVEIRGWKRTSLDIGTSEYGKPLYEPMSAFKSLEDQQNGYRDALLRSPRVLQEPLYITEFAVLRKRERSVGGIAGQEAVWRTAHVNGATYYSFEWQSLAQTGTARDPRLVIQLLAGNESYPEDKPPPQDDLLALWDAVLESARLR